MRGMGHAMTRLLEAVIPFLAMVYIRLVRRSVRWRWVGRPVLDEVLAKRAPVIVTFWHGRILLMPPVTEESVLPVHVLISTNRDGERIARVMRYFGGQTIRGSTRDRRKKRDKGGSAALRKALQRLGAGEIVAVTPDGPRGPRMVAQVGAAAMSIQSGVPVLPFAWATRRARILQSWDRFMMPLPFDRGVYVVGEPLSPPANTDTAAIEAHRQAIETALRDVTERADREMERTPVEPA